MNPEEKEICRKIKEGREHLGFSQVSLSMVIKDLYKVDISKSQIRKIENQIPFSSQNSFSIYGRLFRQLVEDFDSGRVANAYLRLQPRADFATEELQRSYNENPNPTEDEMRRLASDLRFTLSEVHYWFNRK